MDKVRKSIKLGSCYDDLKRFKDLTGISISSAIDIAWEYFKGTKEYAMFMLLPNRKK